MSKNPGKRNASKLPTGKPTGVTSSTKFNSSALENASDLSRELGAPNDAHSHPVNRGVHPGTARSSDWDSGVPEVPSRPTRARVAPDNSNRRAPSHRVTAIASDGHHSHVAEPVPDKL
jgi:hypothetical protein